MSGAAPNFSDPHEAQLAQWQSTLAAKDALIEELRQQVETLKHRVDWFTRQLFGSKSERLLGEADPKQMHLGELLGVPDASAQAPKARTIPAHTRRVTRRDFADDEGSLFFDPSKVPVETIAVPNPAADGLSSDQYTVIGEKVSHRLAQRPASYVVLKYVRKVIKRHDTETLSCAPAPAGVIEGSRADVSLLAGLLVDKFQWHLPLYRQHQRLEAAGFRLSRPWLTQLVQQSIALLEPVYAAQFDAIRRSRVIAMDETPIKAGREKRGKMKTGYFWPVYGEADEVCFPYFPTRAHACVVEALGVLQREDAVLLSDGYEAYHRYATRTGLTHAQCWAHTRRHFFEAQAVEPDGVEAALEQIGALYAIEATMRDAELSGEALRLHRMTHSKPKVDAFFAWIDRQFERQGLLPSNPFTKALAYARERRLGLEVFLTDPAVPIDTNHLERSLRPIPLGRRNWLFCWTELGAKQVGIVQSLLITCRLHGIDPYTYLVDVLQRVGQHPAARVAELTPRQWKQHYADNPLRSDLDKIAG